MKSLILFVTLAAALPATAAIVYEDPFNDSNTIEDPANPPNLIPDPNNILVNGAFLGNVLGGGGVPLVETGGSAQWSDLEGWSWGNRNIHSGENFNFPSSTQKYTVEWKIGPMVVTAAGDQSWGDIRMQLALLSTNAGRGGDIEFWNLTSGGLGVDLTYKGGSTLYANLVGKNDTGSNASNPSTVPGQVNHQIDPAVGHILTLELTSTTVSLKIDGVESQTVPLFNWSLGAGPGEEYENGFFISTRGARAGSGRGTMSLDYIKAELGDVAPPEPDPVPELTIEPARPGVRLVTNESQYGRQAVRTETPEHSWVGRATVANPVTYSMTISSYPAPAAYQAFMYLTPVAFLETWQNEPDWSQRVCLSAGIGNNADGTGYMSLAYKNYRPASNGFPGREYWMAEVPEDLYDGTETDGTPATAIGAPAGSGKGGRVAQVGSSRMTGTWSVTFTSDTDFVITSADGQTSTGSLGAGTAALFSGPLYVHFGCLAGQAANIGQFMEISSVGVTGVEHPINESFAEPGMAGGGAIGKSGTAASIIEVFSGTNPFWIRWTVPDTGLILQRGTALSPANVWTPHAAGSILAAGHRWILAGPVETTGSKGFFRLARP